MTITVPTRQQDGALGGGKEATIVHVYWAIAPHSLLRATSHCT